MELTCFVNLVQAVDTSGEAALSESQETER